MLPRSNTQTEYRLCLLNPEQSKYSDELFFRFNCRAEYTETTRDIRYSKDKPGTTKTAPKQKLFNWNKKLMGTEVSLISMLLQPK